MSSKRISDRRRLALFDTTERLVPVFTIQAFDAVDAGKKLGYLTGSEDHADEHFLSAYNWMREAMRRRLPSYSGDYPVWVDFDKPNVRQLSWPQEHRWLICALVPRSRILISDYDGWHAPLNNWPITKTEKEFDASDGLTQDEIMSSWDAIFDYRPTLAEDREWFGSQRYLQGCVDRIYMSDIRSMKSVVRRVGKNRDERRV